MRDFEQEFYIEADRIISNGVKVFADMLEAKRDNEESENLWIRQVLGEHPELPCKSIYEKYDIPSL